MTFSIIIPLYNKASYVENALQSVFAQTFKDWELIVVDDGSTDDSLEVVKRFADSQVRQFSILSQKNAGVSTARNNGVAASHGDYLCFLDADDWWSPDFLLEMHEFILSYPDAGIYGTAYYYVKNGRFRIYPDIETGYMNYFRTYAKSSAMPLWTGAVCVPLSVFQSMEGFKSYLKLGEDFDLWVRIALRYKVAFWNKPLAYYNQDVDLQYRATRRLQNPKNHILWNLDYLSEEESRNSDLKELLDNLRTYGLLSYYLSATYRLEAQKELSKVDWRTQPAGVVRRYRQPIWWLRLHAHFMQIGSNVKQWIIRKNILR